VNTKDGPTKLVRQDAILGGLSIGQLTDHSVRISELSLCAYVPMIVTDTVPTFLEGRRANV